MNRNIKSKELENLPPQAAEFIELIIKNMRYRKKVREEVMAELAAHFEDELRDCKTDEEKNEKANQLIEQFGDPKLLGTLLRRAKKRCRSLWRTIIVRFFQVVGISILLIIVYTVWFWSGKPNITVNYVTELNKMVPPSVDESLNAAPLYQEAAEMYENTLKFKIGKTNFLNKSFLEITPAEKQQIEELVEDSSKMLELIKEGTEKPYHWKHYKSEDDKVISILLPNSSSFRGIAYVLHWRALLNAEKGKHQDAFNDLITCYRFGSHLRNGYKFVIEQINGMDIERLSASTIRDILSRHLVSSKLLAETQKDMEKIIKNQDFTIDFTFEKLSLSDQIQRSFTKNNYLNEGHVVPKHIVELDTLTITTLSADHQYRSGKKVEKRNRFSDFISDLNQALFEPGGFIHDPVNLVIRFLLHPDRNETRKMADKIYDFIEETAQKTPVQIKAEGIDIDKQIEKIVNGNLLLKIFRPPFVGLIELSYRNKIESYATITVVALLRYKMDTGSYPDSLQQLVTAGYLKQLPMDPFSDKPLVYRRTDHDFILYSVGLNFRDDDGEKGETKQGKTRVWADNGDTVFWPVE